MMNQTILVGRITSDVKEVVEEQPLVITLGVPRSYKNEEGIYDTDFIPVKLSGMIAKNTAEYVKKGDLIGVKGRLQSDEVNGFNMLSVVAERITFLSASRESEGDSNE